jgi:hypothetical protein
MGKPREDLTGKIFNEWTVIEYFGKGKWLCSCSCGKTVKPVKTFYLKSGKSTCCGKCTKVEINIGDKFGEWTVIDNKKYINCESSNVLCKCSCGRTVKEVFIYDLINGKNKRCHYCSGYNFKKGDKYNQWTIMEDGFKLHKDKILCSCSCGRTTEYRFSFEIAEGDKLNILTGYAGKACTSSTWQYVTVNSNCENFMKVAKKYGWDIQSLNVDTYGYDQSSSGE